MLYPPASFNTQLLFRFLRIIKFCAAPFQDNNSNFPSASSSSLCAQAQEWPMYQNTSRWIRSGTYKSFVEIKCRDMGRFVPFPFSFSLSKVVILEILQPHLSPYAQAHVYPTLKTMLGPTHRPHTTLRTQRLRYRCRCLALT